MQATNAIVTAHNAIVRAPNALGAAPWTEVALAVAMMVVLLVAAMTSLMRLPAARRVM